MTKIVDKKKVSKKEAPAPAAGKAAKPRKIAAKPDNSPNNNQKDTKLVEKPVKKASKAAVSTKAEKPSKSDKKSVAGKSKAPPKKKPAKQKKAHATRPTADEEVRIAERRNFVWELKKSGASVRNIQSVLRSRGEEVSLGTIHNDIQMELASLQLETKLSAKDYKTIAHERCEEMWMDLSRLRKRSNNAFEIAELVKQGNNTIKTLIEIGVIERPAKTININPRAELAKLLGVTEEELPDDLGS